MGNFYDVTAVMQVIGGIYLNPSLLDAEEKYNFIEQDFIKFYLVLCIIYII